MNKNPDYKTSIIRYLNGDASPVEKRMLEKWVASKPENARYFTTVKDLFEASNTKLNQIADTQGEWQRLNKRIESHRSIKQSIWKGIQKVAAVLVLPLLMATLLLVNRNHSLKQYAHQNYEMVVPAGSKSQLLLPDSSKVWLNGGSVLSYESFGKDGLRMVHLSGEAFFEVRKDTDVPFVVATKDYDVQVVGTRFNVRSYIEDGLTETSLEEGKVIIKLADGRSFDLMPGQQARANESKGIDIRSVDVADQVCWKENVLRFNNTSLNHMLPMLERWYGVKIKVDDLERVGNTRYTLTIKTETIREVLQLMKFITPIHYSVNGEEVEISYLEHK
jgi:ferric-dicitrate binding protein FerR (iron transport regulator)